MDLKSNEPFWLLKNGIIQSFPSLQTNQDCDVLIVGGGITGSLMAHQCIADGYNTILIDKREIANGSSSATTSMLQYEIDMPLFQLEKMIGIKAARQSYTACASAIDQLEKICKQIKSEAGFQKKESLYFAALKKDIAFLQSEFESRKKAGFEVEWLDANAIQKQFGIHNTHGGILSKKGASVDAFKLVHELLAFNIKKGLQVFDKTELIEVKYGKSINKVMLETGAQIKTKKIIYCVGYESVTMIKEKFFDLISTFAMVSEINENIYKKFNNLLVWNTANPYHYLRTTDDGRMLIGGEDEPFRDPQKRDAMICKKAKRLQNAFSKFVPDIPYSPDFSWAGTFGATKDGLPYIGSHKDLKNSYFVLGFGGNGITFSVAGMEMASNWLKGSKHPLTPIFKFGR